MVKVDGIDQSSEPGESSYFQKTIILGNWWLVKCSKEFEGRRFGVGGTELMTSTGRRAIRVFVSAPIVKVFDCFTIETADGICINLKGFIDKERTLQSGFSPEIFRQFVFGFPPCWKQVLTDCFSGDSPTANLHSTSRTDQSPINSADFPILSPCKNKLDTPEVKHGIESEKITVDYGKVSSKPGNEFPCGSLSSPTKKKSEDDVGSPTGDTVKTSDKKSGDDVGSLVVDTVKTNDKKSEDDVGSATVDTVQTSDKKSGDDVGSLVVDTFKTNDNRSGDDVESPTVDTFKTGDKKSESDDGSPAVDPVKNDDKNGGVDVGSPMVDRVKTNNNKSGDDLGLSEVDMVKPGNRKINQCSMKKLRSSKRVNAEDRGSNNANGSLKDMVSSERVKAKCKPSSALLQSRFEDSNKNAKTGDISISRKYIKSKGGRSGAHEDPSSSDSIKRKIDFDTEVTPRKEKRKEINALLSPDSLNLKRSRSGRLLMSPLEFWRNECPVYDADRTLIGIKEDVNVKTPKKGSSSSKPEGRKGERPVGKQRVSS